MWARACDRECDRAREVASERNGDDEVGVGADASGEENGGYADQANAAVARDGGDDYLILRFASEHSRRCTRGAMTLSYDKTNKDLRSRGDTMQVRL